jgi:hypothetical protein
MLYQEAKMFMTNWYTQSPLLFGEMMILKKVYYVCYLEEPQKIFLNQEKADSEQILTVL